MKAALPKFTAETGIKVVMDAVPYTDLHDKMVTAMASHSSAFDLMSTTDYWLQQFVSAGWLDTLSPYVKDGKITNPAYKLGDIIPKVLDSNVINGQLYALPWKFNADLLVYRKDMMSAPKTDAEWLKDAQNAKSKGLKGVGLSLSTADIPEIFLDLTLADGGKFMNSKKTAVAFDSPQGRKALTFLVDLSRTAPSGATDREWPNSADLLAEGVTESDIISGSSIASAATGKAKGKIGYAALPTVPGGTPGVMNAWSLMIPKGSKHPQAAWMLAEYLASPIVTKAMALAGDGETVPARKSLLTNPALDARFPNFRALEAVGERASLWPKLTTLSAIELAMAAPLQDAVLGAKPVAAALKNAATAADRAMVIP
jgi:ABC-type glycerol-3-phosphate transport system substrate-binding protein